MANPVNRFLDALGRAVTMPSRTAINPPPTTQPPKPPPPPRSEPIRVEVGWVAPTAHMTVTSASTSAVAPRINRPSKPRLRRPESPLLTLPDQSEKRVMDALGPGMSEAGKKAWLRERNTFLDGQIPLLLLRVGEVDKVLAAVQQLNEGDYA